MSDFRPGEIISISVQEARITRVTTEDETLVAQAVVVGDDGKPYYIKVPLEWDTVTVERVAPADWPPQPGDLWRDRFGDLWFGTELNVDGDVTVDLRCAIDKVPPIWAGDITGEYGPLALVYREDQQDADAEQHGGDSCEECETKGRNCTAHGGRPGVTPDYPAPGSEILDQPGYVVGTCGHRVAGSEWRSGFRTCERCPGEGGDQGE